MISSSNRQRVILVTGANKGIGFEVVKKLANDPLTKNDVILLGSRDFERGQQAFVRLGSPANVHVLLLDTSSRESIADASEKIQQHYDGRLDVLINNAALGFSDMTSDAARQIFATNYYGIKMVNKYLFPLLQENARVINVSSIVGAWALYDLPRDLQAKYLSSNLTEKQLDCLVENFISAIDAKSLDQAGYDAKSPFTIYNVSKIAINALTRIQARLCSDENNIMIFAVCPGFCSTDMTRHAPGSRSPELGADSIVYLVNSLENELENGGFYQDGRNKSYSTKKDLDFGTLPDLPTNN